jgi:hypothetical protein
MSVLPKGNEFIEVLGYNPQHVPHIVTPSITRSHRVHSIHERHNSLRPAKLRNHFCLRVEPVHVARLVIVRIREETNAIEPC